MTTLIRQHPKQKDRAMAKTKAKRKESKPTVTMTNQIV